MKGQDELIGKNGVFKKRRIENQNKTIAASSSEDEQFEDALSSPKIESLGQIVKGKEVIEDKIVDKEIVNENKKRVVTTQGRNREDSDDE
ncbi:hypothetical protein RhiirA5_422243 [Rhizophagus irregularis]|uniref:Uncharacterized protein n=2 Tax=Rhizophagus irregularis TaxID=588596 RepID=U9T8K8_RHIID|nr:hypothetical protein GLOIN_2v1781836 [Rhizophagus irregularis DAOM 181602=DAOM 197198]PKC04438.1 hypothetical protein RhiirA5_422243 [Rhizophagus irregularis]PKC60352.1 hypothetical protein RhiirA1_468155 [Rhizophagus irregularis]POG65296.1 hypothetical protein GLOIN_2v1781836 [Rhizophagus irregularis DAOM 181602=DAOM 197198]|eukprot:XP_025172162.1 hypothetical protein GLOIN_2v1781836 [Rhizophagus irregularis DAOM 181602=DAOM 197198]